MRQSIIRITTEIVIPYEKQTFGAAAAAEKTALDIQQAIAEAMTGTTAVSRAWSAKHTTEEGAPVKAKDLAAVPSKQ